MLGQLLTVIIDCSSFHYILLLIVVMYAVHIFCSVVKCLYNPGGF